MLNLQGKVAIVSGCGSLGDGFGNGRAITTLLARQGARVIGTDINEEAGNNTTQFIRKEGNDCTFHKVDMTNEKDVKEFFDNVRTKCKKLTS
jgi:NAD(P)-dependent dehydrogenase (short-subunit alcohol dehydrogenase family)